MVKKILHYFFCFSFVLFSELSYASPYWDQTNVPKDSDLSLAKYRDISALKTVSEENPINVLRVQVDWENTCGKLECERYQLKLVTVEPSGTKALLRRSKNKPEWGSYLGILKNKKTMQPLYYDSIGAGQAYRKIVRAITFRFPIPDQDATLELYAENPKTGAMEKVLTQDITLLEIERLKNKKLSKLPDEIEIKEISRASKEPAVRINFYAEGFKSHEKDDFYRYAAYAVEQLKKHHFPGVDEMSFYAVFGPSNNRIGRPRNLGMPIPTYDSFLGLFYIYWNSDMLERWYHVAYPTSETKFRQALAAAPYDYAIALIHSSEYFGVGNYNVYTAVPVENNAFTYLLLHEMGHMFGLNEEYSTGGRTELEFAPEIFEPWSQNITFLRNNDYRFLKWKKFVDVRTELPTPSSKWRSLPPVYGAYKGGYANSPVAGAQSHTPGFAGCVMINTYHFCEICKSGIHDVVQYSLGSNTHHK